MIKHGAEQFKVQLKRERGQLEGKVRPHCVFSARATQRQGENTNYKGARKCLHQPSASSGPPVHTLQWEELEGVGVHIKGVGKPVVLSVCMVVSVRILRRTHSVLMVGKGEG